MNPQKIQSEGEWTFTEEMGEQTGIPGEKTLLRFKAKNLCWQRKDAHNQTHKG